MRILIINSGRDLYGSEQSMLAALPEGDRLFAIPAGGSLAAELSRRGERFVVLKFNRRRFLQHPSGHTALLAQLIELGLTFRPDVILVNLGGNLPVIIAAAALLRIPLVRFERFEVRGRRTWGARVLESFCEVVLCPSQTVAGQVQRILRKPATRVLPWYDPIAAADAKRPSPPSSGCDIIYVGRICAGKGIDVAIRAMQLVWEKVPDARLLIFGSHDGSPDGARLEQELKALAEQVGAEGRVIFGGFCPDVMERIAASAVLVLPSSSESFGRVLAEAWTLGVPTVASNIPGCAEITRASGGGRLAPVGDVAGFARALSDLLLAKEEARGMGQRGRRWVTENCSPDGYRKRFMTLLEVLNRSPTVV